MNKIKISSGRFLEIDGSNLNIDLQKINRYLETNHLDEPVIYTIKTDRTMMFMTNDFNVSLNNIVSDLIDTNAIVILDEQTND